MENQQVIEVVKAQMGALVNLDAFPALPAGSCGIPPGPMDSHDDAWM